MSKKFNEWILYDAPLPVLLAYTLMLALIAALTIVIGIVELSRGNWIVPALLWFALPSCVVFAAYKKATRNDR